MIRTSIYLKEISDFLQTVTIKNTTFAELIRDNTSTELNVGSLQDKENPYYLNLIGEYSLLDEPMYITSLDTHARILYSKENLSIHNKTRTAYNITSDFYKKLCLAYPDQIDLIKSIRYPVKSIDRAIDADDFEVLNYDSTILESQEVDSLVKCMKDTLSMLKERWYLKEFNYEAFYPIVFWATTWYHLSLSLLLQRNRNIRTSEVHSYHIFEYLSSKGLGKYTSALTHKQSLFLYQNIDYLLKNRGKQSNFDTLISRLFTEIGGAIDNKTIYLSKENSTETLRLTPKIVTEHYSDSTMQNTHIEPGKISSLKTFEYFLSSHPNTEPIVDAQFINKQTELLSIQPTACIPTKFIELSNENVTNDFNEIMRTFIISSYLYLVSKAEANKISVLENTYVADIVLSSSESLALLHYCMRRMDGIEEPTTIPTVYSSPRVFKIPLPTLVADINLNFDYDGAAYKITDYIDVESILSKLSTVSQVCETNEDFEELMLCQVSVLHGYFNFICKTADGIAVEAANRLFEQLFNNEYSVVELIPGYTTYNEWFILRDNIFKLVTAVDSSNVNEHTKWSLLASAISQSSFSLDPRLFAKYGNINEDQSINLVGLKELLTYLSSYNICILDRPYNESRWLTLLNKKYTNKGVNHSSNANLIQSMLKIDSDVSRTDRQKPVSLNIDIVSCVKHASEGKVDLSEELTISSAVDNQTNINYELDMKFTYDFSDLT